MRDHGSRPNSLISDGLKHSGRSLTSLYFLLLLPGSVTAVAVSDALVVTLMVRTQKRKKKEERKKEVEEEEGLEGFWFDLSESKVLFLLFPQSLSYIILVFFFGNLSRRRTPDVCWIVGHWETLCVDVCSLCVC